MEKNYKHNAKPRKIIFPLNERENGKEKGSVNHLMFSGKLGPLSPNPPHKPQAHGQAEHHFLHFQIFDKTVAELSVSKKMKFLSTLSQCLLQQAC